jgi:integrase
MPARRGNGEGSIYQRSDGRWVGSVSVGKGKRKYLYGKTRREVAEKLKKALAEQQQGLPLANEKQTVDQYLQRWLEDSARPTVRAGTFESYQRLIRLHVRPHIGKVPLARLTAQDLSRLYRTLLDHGLAPRSVQYVHAVLHRALGQALRWNLIARNPAELVDAPRPKRKEIAPLTPDQAKALLDAARGDRLEALYVVALTSGLRLGELLALRWADLDGERGELHVRRTLVRTQAGLSFNEPKTAKGRRTVRLPSFAVAALREHRARQLEERLRIGPAWDGQDLIFPNEVGRPIDRQNLIRRSFKKLLQKAGLPDVRFHDLRHTAATLLLRLGEHPKVVQERLGHSTISVTMDVYSHVLPDMQRQAAEKLDTLFGVG